MIDPKLHLSTSRAIKVLQDRQIPVVGCTHPRCHRFHIAQSDELRDQNFLDEPTLDLSQGDGHGGERVDSDAYTVDIYLVTDLDLHS